MKLLSRPALLAIAALFVLLPTTASGGGLGIPVILSLAGALSIRLSLVRQAIENKPATIVLLLAFTGWTILSSAWSAYPDHAQALKLALLIPLGLMFAAAAAADPSARRLAQAGGLAAFIALTPLMAVEVVTNMALNHIATPDVPIDELGRHARRAITIILAMSWGVAGGLLALGGRVRLAGALAVLIVAGWMSLQFDMEALTIAFVLGLAAFASALIAPRPTIWVVTGSLAGWVLAAPFLTPVLLDFQRPETLPLSWAARVEIWEYVCGRIAEAPLLGHGLDASRLTPDRISMHPHSASLQIWFELGAVGALLGAAALVVGGLSLARAFGGHRPAAAAASASLVSLGLIANVSFGLWQEWWIATMFIAAVLVGAIGVRIVKA